MKTYTIQDLILLAIELRQYQQADYTDEKLNEMGVPGEVTNFFYWAELILNDIEEIIVSGRMDEIERAKIVVATWFRFLKRSYDKNILEWGIVLKGISYAEYLIELYTEDEQPNKKLIDKVAHQLYWIGTEKADEEK